jgi:hypothetical protein
VLHLLFCLMIAVHSASFFSTYFMYFLLVILPLSLIYPLDIVYREGISLLEYRAPIQSILIVGVWIISMIYYVYIKTRRSID